MVLLRATLTTRLSARCRTFYEAFIIRDDSINIVDTACNDDLKQNHVQSMAVYN